MEPADPSDQQIVTNFYNEELPMFSIDEMRRHLAIETSIKFGADAQPGSEPSTQQVIDSAALIEAYLRGDEPPALPAQ